MQVRMFQKEKNIANMMKEIDPPSYEFDTVAVGSHATSINLGFLPDEDLTEARKQPTDPVLETGNFQGSQPTQSTSFPPLTVEDIKRACHFYVSERCCYGSRFIENMKIIEVSDRIAYHYTLESYAERRETTDQTKPYYGSAVDGPPCGPTVRPWDVPVTPPTNFQKDKKVLEVPRTSYVNACSKCTGKGKISCKWCLGVGGSGCVLCLSNKKYRPCTNCKYSGNRCLLCDGQGTEKCKTCDGQGKLRTYKILIVTWTTHTDHYVTDTMNLPAEEIREAQGRLIFNEEAEELSPAWNVPNTSVIAASTELINRHREVLDNEVIRRQRHTFRAVPFTHVKYSWREDIGEFYVYGLEKKAYFENYPQECCCCCSIM